jgi:ABC-2 type transport system permease protein
VLLVAQRELNTRLRTKSFVFGTIVIIAVIAGYLLLQMSVAGDVDRTRVGLSGQATHLAAEIQRSGEALGMRIETHAVADGEAGAQLASGEADVVVSGTAAEPRALVRSELNPALAEILAGISRQEVLTAELAKSGVDDPAAVLARTDQAQIQVEALEGADPAADQRLAIGLVMVFLLFFGISSYGTLVAQGVIEEKSSRVVEILLATVRPWQLLLGKVIGIGLVGLCQLLLIASAGLAMAVASGVVTVAGVGVSTLLWGALWYVLGYFTYATIYAGAGALVSRQEDAQSVLTPVTIVLFVGFVVGFTVMMANPDGPLSRTLSVTPLLAPILMPGRIAAGGVAGWEIALAVALTVLAAALLTWVGGRMYSHAVLRTGSRLKLAEALRGP